MMDWFVSLWTSSLFWEIAEYSAEGLVFVGAALAVLTDFKYILKTEDGLRERIAKVAANYARYWIVFRACCTG
jgi:hypothetical protein